MRDPFDQLVKRLARRALAHGGTILVEHEVAPDAAAIDVWFEPFRTRSGGRADRGLLGRMVARPSMLEAYHKTPGIDAMRGCMHKQLALDRVRCAEARRRKRRRPAFPQMWLLSTGRPASVLESYGLTPIPGFPAGCWGRHAADALGVVVLRELPRERDTLLLRLMGAGEVLRRAIAELIELPGDAWEREVAMEELIALRFEIPQHAKSTAEREYLMTTQQLYEHWKRHYRDEGVQQGLERGVKSALVTLYRSRFGALPATVAAAIEATHDEATLDRWVALVGTASHDEVEAALGARRRTAVSARRRSRQS